MEIDAKQLANEFRELKANEPTKVPEQFDEDSECEHVAKLLHVEERLDKYESPHASGAGGSGLVINAVHTQFGNVRAIKIPRLATKVTGKPEEDPFVDPELHALSKLSHQNITRLYEAFRLKNGGVCTVTEYVDAAKSLDQYADSICCTKSCRESEYVLLRATRLLAKIIYEVAEALVYMHNSASLIHSDIKPDNILVSGTDRVFITDLGFARDTSKYKKPGEMVEVGFTWKYAHPTLTDPDRGARISTDPRRARTSIPQEQLLPVIDIFAFGRTLQQVLKTLEVVHGDSIHSNYVLNFLHIVACLCLDGENSSNGQGTSTSTFVSDRALGMPAALFASHKFKTFDEILIVLQRLLGLRRLEDELPEVDRWSSSTINISDLGPTTLTPRVRSLLNHSAMQRLGGELQLGKLDTVFPTATHTRLQHSFGVYHDAREYISALYYDPENPTFRVIFSPDGGRKCLVAAIVHDLGQTSFGHDLEEVDPAIFSHEKITERILKSDFYTDGSNRTLKTLIEGEGEECWDIQLQTVLDLIADKGTLPVDALLHDIINGQLDADKLDYLLRDSIECRVQYGRGIDYERFLRSLTTKAYLDGTHAKLRLAVEQKGAASAEAFAFARYQLYQSVYWHHTFRAVKAMLLDAATSVLKELKTKHAATSLLFNEVILNAFLTHVVEFKSSLKLTSDELLTDIEGRLKAPAIPANASKYSKDETLVFFWKLASGKARTLLEDLINRNYYKRVLEISLGNLSHSQELWIRDNLKGPNRLDLREGIEKTLLKTMRTAIQDQMKTRASLVTDEVLQKTEAIAARKVAFTIDLPLRAWEASGDSPLFVSDYKRRHFRSGIGSVEPQENRLWSGYLPELMKGKAFFRVCCEPELHKILIRVLRAVDISEAIYADFPKLKPQSQKV
jgi:HD superfamily phosphohydrolase